MRTLLSIAKDILRFDVIQLRCSNNKEDRRAVTALEEAVHSKDEEALRVALTAIVRSCGSFLGAYSTIAQCGVILGIVSEEWDERGRIYRII